MPKVFQLILGFSVKNPPKKLLKENKDLKIKITNCLIYLAL